MWRIRDADGVTVTCRMVFSSFAILSTIPS